MLTSCPTKIDYVRFLFLGGVPPKSAIYFYITEFKRDFTGVLWQRLAEPLNFIQVLIGPRQVGKTTAVTAIAKQWQGPVHFESADAPTPPGPDWFNL